jgi:hypothetical protein
MQFHQSTSTTRTEGSRVHPPAGGASAIQGPRSLARTRNGAVILALLVAGSTAACSSGGTDGEAGSVAAKASTGVAAKASASAPSASASSAAPTQSPSPSPTGGGPTPTPGPSAIPKVSRPGQPTKPSVSAAPKSFTAPVSYGDGITVTVDKVTPGVETGHGPGIFAGREFAVFTVTMHNGTKKPMDAQQVVVTSTYGKRNLVAERVYAADAKTVDFGGRLAPGADATARYAFAVPAKQLGDARLVVDFDGTHTSAEFDGDARKAS